MGWTCCATSSIAFTFTGLFLMAVGFSIPFWLSYSQPVTENGATRTYNLYMGTWYLMACEKGESNSCSSEPIEPKFNSRLNSLGWDFNGTTAETLAKSGANALGSYVYWWAVQICTTVGLGLVLLAALVLLCCRCAGIHSRGFFVISGLIMLLGSIPSLAISILQPILIALVFSIPGYSVTAETFPWSVLLFGFGSLISIIAAIMVLVVSCKWRDYGEYREQDKESISEDERPVSPSGIEMMSRSQPNYDRPRLPPSNGQRNGYDRRPDYGGFSKSKKYRDPYDDRSRDRDYGRSLDRGSRNQGYEGYDRGHYPPPSYEKSDTGGNSLSASRQDNMYRPYSQYKY
ncbi:uncharacterized protein LOC128218709 [Mya arenaria]|uniref:uncharacterized protein LOC128218709 n=1 Tax=Mya arenaria TaxID=6604 RepID=UPI0022E075D5|nr:uncharacterized protein LOC128218709 [Mya arenaria]